MSNNLQGNFVLCNRGIITLHTYASSQPCLLFIFLVSFFLKFVLKKKYPQGTPSNDDVKVEPTEDRAPILKLTVTHRVDLKPIKPELLIPPNSEVRSSTIKIKVFCISLLSFTKSIKRKKIELVSISLVKTYQPIYTTSKKEG